MKKLIFIDNFTYFESLKSELEKHFELFWFLDINGFHKNLVDKSEITAIILCEFYPSYISSIKHNLILARYYKYRMPVVLLSFLPFEFLTDNKAYNLQGLALDKSHLYLQLPIENEELISVIEVASPVPENMNSSDFTYVRANKVVIDHIVNRPITTSQKHSIPNNQLKYCDMNKPVHKILVIEDNPKDIEIAFKNLVKFIEDNPLDFEFDLIHVNRGDLVEQKLKECVDIQSVMLDWYLEEISGEIQNPSQKDLVQIIKELRPELPIYIFTRSSDPYEIVDECGKDIKGYFTKNQFHKDPSSVFNRIISDFNKRRTAPFWDAFKKYVNESNDSWHTPGHARGTSFRESPFFYDFYDFFKSNTFAADLSVSVEKLGSLLDSTHAVKEAQEKAAKTFGSKRVFFTTNGSSTSNKVIIQTMLRPGDGVIIDRNCHKSVHYGAIQAGVGHVTYLNSEYSEKYRIFAPPSIEEIRNKIQEAKKRCEEKGITLKAIIITGCTYDGMLIDVKKVVEIAHENTLKLFIDEAWFAYSGFHYKLRDYSAIHSKADYVTHSAHKVLSAFSQASIIHINDKAFDPNDSAFDESIENYFREIFYIYTSTSPQYQMIASLDIASTQMEVEGYRVLDDTLKLAEGFREKVNKLKNIKALTLNDFKDEFDHIQNDNIGHDPLKVLLDISLLDYKVEDIHQYLIEEGGLEIEKDTTTTILVLFTIGSSPDKAARLYLALKKLADGETDLIKIGRKFKNIKIKTDSLDTYSYRFNYTENDSHIKINIEKKYKIDVESNRQLEIAEFEQEIKRIIKKVNFGYNYPIIDIALKDVNGNFLYEENFLYDKLRQLDTSLGSFPFLDLMGNPDIAFFTSKRKEFKIEEINELNSNNKFVSVNLVTPYPPGIPLLVPNQLITKKHISIINNLLDEGVHIHGCKDKKIWIADSEEINIENHEK